MKEEGHQSSLLNLSLGSLILSVQVPLGHRKSPREGDPEGGCDPHPSCPAGTTNSPTVSGHG